MSSLWRSPSRWVMTPGKRRCVRPRAWRRNLTGLAPAAFLKWMRICAPKENPGRWCAPWIRTLSTTRAGQRPGNSRPSSKLARRPALCHWVMPTRRLLGRWSGRHRNANLSWKMSKRCAGACSKACRIRSRPGSSNSVSVVCAMWNLPCSYCN